MLHMMCKLLESRRWGLTKIEQGYFIFATRDAQSIHALNLDSLSGDRLRNDYSILSLARSSMVDQ